MIRRPGLVSSEEIDLLLEWRRTSESEEAAGLVPLVAVIGERSLFWSGELLGRAGKAAAERGGQLTWHSCSASIIRPILPNPPSILPLLRTLS